MNKEDAEKYLRLLGLELQKQGIVGEILVHDEIKVLLDIKKPEVRRNIDAYLAGDENAIFIPNDIDAYFGGNSIIRALIAQITVREGLSEDWLDEAIRKILYVEVDGKGWEECLYLRVYLALPAHLFAMQIATATSVHDIEVIERLAQKLHVSTMRGALSYAKQYIPDELLTLEMRLSIKQAMKLLRANRKVQAK